MSQTSEHEVTRYKMGDEVAHAALALGIDLSVKQTFHFYFYVADTADVQYLATRLKEFHCSCELDAPAVADEDWLCFATYVDLFAHEAFNRLGVAFLTLAAEFGGVYDGWEFGASAERSYNQNVLAQGILAFDAGDHSKARALFEELMNSDEPAVLSPKRRDQ